MILVDFSGLIFKNVFGITKSMELPLVDGKYIIDNAITPIKNFIINDIFDIQKQFNDNNIVICVDDTYKGSWRAQIYKPYKSHRKVSRDDNPIPFDIIFNHVHEIIDAFDKFTPYKVIKVPTAEADDCILTLCETIRNEDIVIYSSDKDMLQMQKYNNVRQYSPLLKKYITYKDKSETLNEWLVEHIVLGDNADEVPKIFSETEFTPEFIKYLNDNQLNYTPSSYHALAVDNKLKIENNFNGSVWKTNRIGKKTVEKHIQQGTLKDLIKSNELYVKNFERNKKLILADYIPQSIKEQCLKQYNTIKSDDMSLFIKYLEDNNMRSIQFNIPNFTPIAKLDFW